MKKAFTGTPAFLFQAVGKFTSVCVHKINKAYYVFKR
jgi:hypothetical protein